MTETMLPRLRKSWHVLRRRLGAGARGPERLVVQKAKWLGDARSPVMLMIDDLTNAWHGERDGAWAPGGDWGGGRRQDGSALRFLEDRLLRDFPEAKVTFFTVAGPISPYTRHQPFAYSAPLDADAASSQFFRSLTEHPQYELAYHGFNHGTPGATSTGFVQEWRGFPSVDAAIEQTQKGLDIFARATGVRPRGGKYGGWDYNGFAEEALNACGFLWWCRDWTPRDVSGRVPDDYYEPQFFGRNLVVSLPSTVHGYYWDRKQIDLLLERRQVIAIAEHISGVRPDGLVQTPNIVDDIAELRRLYAYLQGKHVWHATGSEIASYVVARERSVVYDVGADGFRIHYDGRIPNPTISLKIDGAAICTRKRPLIRLRLPDGREVPPEATQFDRESFRHIVTVPVLDGRYEVNPAAAQGRSAA